MGPPHYAWIAANYSKGNLAKASENGTIGILELGGASAQIAFVPNDSQSEGIELVRIAGRKYQVYARGYDGIGKDKIVANFKDTESCYPNEFITTAGVWCVGNYSDCKDQIETRFEATKSNVFEKLRDDQRDDQRPDYGEKELSALSGFYYTPNICVKWRTELQSIQRKIKKMRELWIAKKVGRYTHGK